MQTQTASFALCAICGLFLVSIGLWYAYAGKIKEAITIAWERLWAKQVVPWQGTTPARAYSDMIDAVVEAQSSADLDRIICMMNDFAVVFSGKIPDLEIMHYINDIEDEVRNRRAEMFLAKIRRFSNVSA